jgi:hypothetical protein
MRVFSLASTALALTLTSSIVKAQQPPLQPQVPDYPAMVKRAVEKSLPLVQKSASASVARAKCVSCHNQSLPSMTFALARERGFTVDEKVAKEQTQVVYNTFAGAKEVLRQARTQAAAERILDTITVDPAATVSYLGAGLAAEKWQRDEVTELMALYLAGKQNEEGYWPLLDARPPLQSSDFSTTALSIRVLQTYAPAAQEKAIAERIARAQNWLRTAVAKTNEDRAFRLLGLHWSGAGKSDIKKAVEELLAAQHDDGGWAQTDSMKSDAYATGQALVALNMAGGIPITHAAYSRGYKYLLKIQKEDGSWFVEARTTPVQIFVDTDFPHGKNQFLSLSATCWATMALSLTVEPKSSKVAASR